MKNKDQKKGALNQDVNAFYSARTYNSCFNIKSINVRYVLIILLLTDLNRNVLCQKLSKASRDRKSSIAKNEVHLARNQTPDITCPLKDPEKRFLLFLHHHHHHTQCFFPLLILNHSWLYKTTVHMHILNFRLGGRWFYFVHDFLSKDYSEHNEYYTKNIILLQLLYF